MMWHMGDGWGWWMVFGTIFMVAFWVIIIWAVANLGRPSNRDTVDVRRSGEPTALEILERRYARGELTDQEFESMRNRLITHQSG